MIITHSVGAVSEKDKNADFLLVNKRGSYFCLTKDLTNYQGLHYLYQTENSWSYYKIIDDIRLEKNPREIINHSFFVERKSLGTTEKFYFLNHGLVYDIQNYEGSCFLDLDFRDIYDYDDKERVYKITQEKGLIIIEYKKFSKSFFLVISGAESFEKQDKWVEKKYSYDFARASKSSFWVYSALSLTIRGSAHLLFSYGETRKDAIKNLESLEKSKSHIIHLEHTYLSHIKSLAPKKANGKSRAAYINALKSLENLILSLSSGGQNTTGLFAGLPWFFQFWTRDELISLKALMLAKKYTLCKLILFSLLDSILDDGRLQNRKPSANLGTADGAGWLFKRLADLISVLEKNRQLKSFFSKKDFDFMTSRLEFSIQKTQEKYIDDFLVCSYPKETWMDTDFGNDNRDGKRVEIQALWLNMLSLMVKLLKMAKKPAAKYSELLERTSIKAKDVLFHKGVLWDGEKDPTARPNIFLAHYIYPCMLTKKEWLQAFQDSIPKLWLSWGGVATIDKNNMLFCSVYTGQTNQSYHRGDSWYWINNITAISLYKTDKKLFKEYIEKILEASLEDCLFKGFIGHCSELSSASRQDASGCWCQSWSNATLIELIEEIYN